MSEKIPVPITNPEENGEVSIGATEGDQRPAAEVLEPKEILLQRVKNYRGMAGNDSEHGFDTRVKDLADIAARIEEYSLEEVRQIHTKGLELATEIPRMTSEERERIKERRTFKILLKAQDKFNEIIAGEVRKEEEVAAAREKVVQAYKKPSSADIKPQPEELMPEATRVRLEAIYGRPAKKESLFKRIGRFFGR